MEKSTQPIVVDAQAHIAGRLCSIVAKLLLKGNRVVIVNSELTLLSGRRSSVFDEQLKRLKISSVTHPKHGPFHPRTPNSILTRMVRGMVPRRKAKGLDAMKKLRVYTGTPLQYVSASKTVFKKAKATKPLTYYVSLKEVASRLGGVKV